MIRRNKLDMDIMRITTDKRIHIFYDFALYLSWSPLEHVCSFITKSLSFNIEIPIKIPLQSHWTDLRIIDPWKHLSIYITYHTWKYRQWVYTDKIESVQYYCDTILLLPFSTIWPFPFLTKQSVRIFWIAMFGKAT